MLRSKIKSKDLLPALKTSIEYFESNNSKEMTVQDVKTPTETFYFYGVNANEQSHDQIRTYRSQILKNMMLPIDSPIIQVIGDSAAFGASPENKALDPLDRVDFARDFLFSLLDKNPKHAILYGFTGKKGDVNGLVSEWIDTHSSNCLRVLGNAVSKHTPMAIDCWGCGYGNVNHVTVVYPNALFGADVKLTDLFVPQYDNHPGSSFGISLEGGVQSFLQMINMLSLDIPIFAVEKLRGPANEGCKLNGKFGTFFSASEFFSLIKTASQKAKSENREISREEIEKIRNNYLHSFQVHGPYDTDKHKHLRVFANPARNDYETKIGLFTEAFNKFFELNIWKKLDLITIVDCEVALKECEIQKLQNESTTKNLISLVAKSGGSPLHSLKNHENFVAQEQNHPKL